jgi:hypothetical protein
MKFGKLIVTQKINNKLFHIVFLGILIFLGFFVFNVNAAQDAILSISPNTGSYSVGTILSVGVYVSSPTQSINAISGTINFSANELEVVSITKSNSIIDFWVQEPSFSNSEGHVYFEGVILSPGFIGSKGQVVLVNFKTKSSGTALLSFSSGSILANDGLGTNIFKESGSAVFDIQKSSKPVSQQQESGPIFAANTSSNTSLVPNISSLSHPDQDKWYNNTTANLSWIVPSDVVSVSLLINKQEDSVPYVIYTPPISNKEIPNLDDGIWYFHSQFKDSAGWDKVGHYRIKIDTQSPQNLSVEFPEGEEIYTSKPTIILDSTDNISGIDYYKITINSDSIIVYPKDLSSNNFYVLPSQSAGKKTVLVEVFDKAGNSESLSKEITIKTINLPIIEEYPKQIKAKDTLVIKGSAWYDDADITISFKKGNEEIKTNKVKTNKLGEFTLVLQEGLSNGVYRVWAETKNKQGMVSPFSEEIIIDVKNPSIIELDPRGLLVVSLVILSIFILYALLYTSCMVNNYNTKKIINRYLNRFRKDLDNKSKKLYKIHKKNDITEEEERIIKSLEKKIIQIDKYLVEKTLEINDKNDDSLGEKIEVIEKENDEDIEG